MCKKKILSDKWLIKFAKKNKLKVGFVKLEEKKKNTKGMEQ